MEGLPGVAKIETDLKRDLFIIEYDPAQITPATIIEKINDLGFTGKEIAEAIALAAPDESEDPTEKSAQIAELLAQARRENKALVLEFSGKFCPACRRLEKETLADPRVQDALKKVIFRQIMVEKDRAAAYQFDIHAIPQLRFISPSGVVIGKDKGVTPVQTMLDHLEKLEGAK